MISLGLLWFDDDARRTVARKVADALARYRDRVGYEPTVCLLHPTQAAALAAPAATMKPRARRGGGKDAAKDAAAVTLPKTLRLVPSEHISPHYFMVGVAAGEAPRRVSGRLSTAEEEYEGSGIIPRRARPSAQAPKQALKHASKPVVARAGTTTTAPAMPARARRRVGTDSPHERDTVVPAHTRRRSAAAAATPAAATVGTSAHVPRQARPTSVPLSAAAQPRRARPTSARPTSVREGAAAADASASVVTDQAPRKRKTA
ncbi:MAG: hypothetical protein IVW57_09270 [Ktedonobacterales bacterium]|nr:hypothetical protein [Ktedonobacterales bacterium]